MLYFLRPQLTRILEGIPSSVENSPLLVRKMMNEEDLLLSGGQSPSPLHSSQSHSLYTQMLLYQSLMEDH